MADIKNIISRLDSLDGWPDEKFINILLRDSDNRSANNNIAACEALDEADPSLDPQLGQLVIKRKNVNGQTVIVDCVNLTEKLDRLLYVAEKLPAQRFFAQKHQLARQGQQAQLPLPNPADTYLYYLLGDMMLALVLGTTSDETPMYQIFSALDFAGYSGKIQAMGAEHQQPDFSQWDVQTAQQALEVVTQLASQYRFNPKLFQPPKKVENQPASR